MNHVPNQSDPDRAGSAPNKATFLGKAAEERLSVEFKDRCTPEFLSQLAPAPGIGAFSRYSPQAADRQHAALITVASLGHGRVLVAHHERELLAYLTFHPPEGQCRWSSLPFGKILELGGIEVARGFRGMGLARRLMDQAFCPPDFDDVIVYAQALTWCWDLEGTGKTVTDYRQMMLRLFGVYGFESYITDEPNIRYDHTSFLLARMGPRTQTTLIQAFEALLIEGDKEQEQK